MSLRSLAYLTSTFDFTKYLVTSMEMEKFQNFSKSCFANRQSVSLIVKAYPLKVEMIVVMIHLTDSYERSLNCRQGIATITHTNQCSFCLYAR